MISLSTSAFYERANRQIGSLRSQADELQKQIGSGSRLSRSSDDPVAAARVRMLTREQRLTAVDQRNSNMASDDLKLTGEALGSIADVIVRAKELATQASNGTLSSEQRASIGSEVQGLLSSLVMTANSRNGTGHSLFGGQATDTAYSFDGSTASYVGFGQADAVILGEGQEVSSTLTGPEFLEFDHAGNPTDLFKVLSDFALALQADAQPADAARSAMDGLDAGLQKVTTAQTVIGARMGWVEALDQRRETTGEMIADEQATISGADLASTVTRLQEIMTILEASQASFVRLSQLSLFSFLR